MPNLYASVSEIKAALPDGFRSGTSKYDSQIHRLSGLVSRAIDDWTHRAFYPTLATRYLNGIGRTWLWVPDLLSITSVSYSDDDGATYTLLTSDDYYATAAGDFNSPQTYSVLVVNANSTTLGYWPVGQRSIKVVGVWAYADDRAACWESTGDTVEDNPLSSSATTLTVNDVDGLDLAGGAARFQPGMLYRIESEYVEATLDVNAAANTVGLLRARNGTTGAQHAQNTAIDVWRPPEAIKQAAIIQAVRGFMRGVQGYGDARGGVDGAEVYYQRQWDPEAVALMAPYRNPTVA